MKGWLGFTCSPYGLPSCGTRQSSNRAGSRARWCGIALAFAVTTGALTFRFVTLGLVALGIACGCGITWRGAWLFFAQDHARAFFQSVQAIGDDFFT
jgi:hypothetical protein